MFMKGVFNERPPQPRYKTIWNPKVVLDLLKKPGWYPARHLSLKKLTLKLTLLLLLTSGHRCETIRQLDIDHMLNINKCYTFTLSGLIKQSRPGFKNPQPTFKEYVKDKRLCVHKYISVYIERTKNLRGSQSQLLLTFQKPHHPPTGSTVSRWVKSILKLAGVDTVLFGPHSCRAAATSAGVRGGVHVEDIMKGIGWSKQSTFANFYHKPLAQKQSLQDAVLNA